MILRHQQQIIARDPQSIANLLPPLTFLQFVKRDTIRDIEKAVQQRWERERIFEMDAPKVRRTFMTEIIIREFCEIVFLCLAG